MYLNHTSCRRAVVDATSRQPSVLYVQFTVQPRAPSVNTEYRRFVKKLMVHRVKTTSLNNDYTTQYSTIYSVRGVLQGVLNGR